MGLLSWLSGKKTSDADAPPPPAPAPQDEAALLEELAAGLSSRKGAARVDAARALLDRWRSGDMKAAELIAPRVGELLEDDEPQVRITGLSGVRLFARRENVEKHASATIALLADPVAQVRAAAVWSVARLPGEAAHGQLVALLSSSEEALRFASACALAEKHDKACLPELLKAVHEDHRRQEALSALMALGAPEAVPELRALFDAEEGEGPGIGAFDRVAVAAALARLGDEAGKDHLVACLEEYSDERPVAAEWVGRLGIAAAIPQLEELSAEEGDPAQGAALRALGRLQAPGAAARLLALAGDDEAPEDLRLDAAEGLAELGTPEARALLEKLAQGPADGELALNCRELLGELAVADAVKAAQAEAQAAAAKATSEAAAAAAAPAEPPKG